jgi:hypothetical protein
MATGRLTRVVCPMAASLLGSCAGLFGGGYADARADGLSLALAAPGTPLIGSSVPGARPLLSVPLPSLAPPGGASAGLSVPSVGVTVPVVTVTTPVATVTTPSVTVTTPSVGASKTGVEVTAPSVSISAPSVAVSTPSTPVTGKSETPAAGSAPSAPGGGDPGAPGKTPSTPTTSDNPPVASSSDSAPVTSSHAADAGARATKAPLAASGVHEQAQTSRGSARKPRRQRHLAAGAAASNLAGGGLGGGPGDPSPARSTATSRSASHHTSNPLDTIGRHIPLPLPVPDWSKPIILALLLLALWFGVRARMASRRARRLEAQRAALLRDVGAMQAALVPEIPARVGGLAVSVAYSPADGPAAGGDFYDVFVPERGKVAIILGDVAGHGHGALAQAALTRYTLRAYMQAGLEPRAALALAGRALADSKLEHFATVAVGVFDAREGRLVYASAGHPPPILHGLQTREPLSICASPPVGWTVPTGRRQTTVSLPPGAVACFFSDGLIEARCEEDLLGRERVSEMLEQLGPHADAAKLLERVREAALATPDDMAACIVMPQMTVIPARVHIEELEVDAAALGTVQVRRFLETCLVPAVDIELTLRRASDIAAMFGTAVLKIDLGPTTATVVAVPPRPEPHAESPRHDSHRPAPERFGAS